MIKFRNWLLSEQVGSDIIFAKATNKDGLDSILKNGFQLQDRHSSAQNSFEKGEDRTAEQNYGPGLYFSFTSSVDSAKSNCYKYKDWGKYIILASIKNRCRLLVTSWLPENHPIWKLTPAGRVGVYDQLIALGVIKNFPEFNKNDTYVKPEWGYKLSRSIDAWVHEHNMIPHIVVYNPKILSVLDYFECESKESKLDSKNFVSSKVAPNINPQTGIPYDYKIPLSKQFKFGALDAKLKEIEKIQSNPNHPEYKYWKDYSLFPGKKPSDNGLSLDDI